QTLNDQDAVVAWSGEHAIFVDRMANGEHVADHFGTPYYWNGTDTIGDGTSGAYTFKPRTFPSQQYAVGPSPTDGGGTSVATTTTTASTSNSQ
ncbi:MAG: hypothetical protein ACYCW6_30510, partial [Candidatus Xenobia bacterium]